MVAHSDPGQTHTRSNPDLRPSMPAVTLGRGYEVKVARIALPQGCQACQQGPGAGRRSVKSVYWDIWLQLNIATNCCDVQACHSNIQYCPSSWHGVRRASRKP